MAYASRKDIEHAAGGAVRLVQLADWDGDGVADDDVIASARDKAEGIIDSYAAMRYAVPVARPSRTFVQLAAEETVYWLRERRGRLDDTHHLARDLRLQWLVQLAKGRVRPSEPLPPKSRAVVNRYGKSRRAVSRERMKGFW